MKHSVLEAWLASRGYPFRYVESVAIDAILVDDAAKENIRLGVPLNEERVMTYAIELENGAHFPAIVLWPAKAGHYVVANGLHRLEAFKLHGKLKAIDAYVIESSDPVVLEVLRRTVNVMEGEALPMEQRIEHALRLIELQHSIADAARLEAVPANRLAQAVALSKVRPRLARAGVNVRDLCLSGPTLASMNSIPRDRHLAAAVRLAHEARLSSDEIKLLVREIRAASDDTVADETLVAWHERHADTIARAQKGTIRPPGSPIRRLDSLFAQSARLLAGGVAEKGIALLSGRELTAMIARVKKMIAELQTFLVMLQKAKRRAA